MLYGDEPIYKKIKFLIGEQNLSITDLAKRLGVTRKTVYNYLKEDSDIGVDMLMKICEVYGVPLTFFIQDKQISELQEKLKKFEFIIYTLLLEKWSKEGKAGAPTNYFEFPEYKALETLYLIDKDPLYGEALAKKMEARRPKRTKKND